MLRQPESGPAQIEYAMSQPSFDYDTFLNQVVDALCRRGLRLPALIALEAGQPLAFLGGQFLWLAQPLISLFLPTTMVSQAAQLLEEPAAVATLIARLEARQS
jgi:hypothetical protein